MVLYYALVTVEDEKVGVFTAKTARMQNMLSDTFGLYVKLTYAVSMTNYVE